MAAAPILLAMSDARQNGLLSFVKVNGRVDDVPSSKPDDGNGMSGLAEGGPTVPLSSDSAATAESVVSTVNTAPVWPIHSKPKTPPRKRRKVHHAGPEPTVQDGAHDHLSTEFGMQSEQATAADDGLPGVTMEQERDMRGKTDAAANSPKKMLKLNAAGGLGSPSHTRSGDAEALKPRKRGRPRKVDMVAPRSLLVKLRYPTEHTKVYIDRVTGILAGTDTFSLPAKAPLAQKTAASQPKPGLPKSTHPFFSGKPKKQTGRHNAAKAVDAAPPLLKSPARKSTAATPGKIRREVAEMKASMGLLDSIRESTVQASPHKGAIWPPYGMLHMRGSMHLPDRSMGRPTISARKQKSTRESKDDIMHVLGHCSPSALSKSLQEGRERLDGFRDPDPGLRLAKRDLLTGLEIQSYVRTHLSGLHSDHAAISSLLNSIPGHLTAYDHGHGDSRAWTRKYAPSTAATVLQLCTEASYLRDWMKTLAVDAVSKNISSFLKVPETRPRKKRRKKAEDLDDFIVSSGDESEQLGSLSDLDEPGSQGSRSGNLVRSMARTIVEKSKAEGQKASNAIVLSGPPGCGKTAMVYAAAKELNFQVFEINAGSRRSGRDVLERIGDVIGNHIVGHDKQDGGNTSADEDAVRVTAALQKDIESGRQGNMMSFFKAAPIAKAKVEVNKVPKKRQAQFDAIAKTEPRKSQKQSIILLEEVDVLFEEDKAFWPTIITLLATSRRPIIMTCTDETNLPLEDYNLQAILRLTPPPQDLVTDYLLLIAAQEGHLLGRQAVDMLYRHKQDLRASITKLQFWCQMGIGDPRGGLSWIFQRWPPGTGVDAHGNAQRVVSNGTYHAAMGLLPAETGQHTSAWEEDVVGQAWHDWSVDPRDEIHFAQWEVASACSPHGHDRRPSLKEMKHLAVSLSDLDMVCRHDIPPSHGPATRFAPLGSAVMQYHPDPTQPKIKDKARRNYTESPRLLQDIEEDHYQHLTRQIAVSACGMLRHQHQLWSPQDTVRRLHERIVTPQPPLSYQPKPATTFYEALEPLAEPPSTSSQQSPSGNYTSLISPLPILTTDIAPYIRSIAAYDQKLEEERKRLHEVMHGGTEGKMRKTRAARGALEGKGRGGVRREKWWDAEIDVAALEGTGPDGANRLRREWQVAAPSIAGSE